MTSRSDTRRSRSKIQRKYRGRQVTGHSLPQSLRHAAHALAGLWALKSALRDCERGRRSKRSRRYRRKMAVAGPARDDAPHLLRGLAVLTLLRLKPTGMAMLALPAYVSLTWTARLLGLERHRHRHPIGGTRHTGRKKRKGGHGRRAKRGRGTAVPALSDGRDQRRLLCRQSCLNRRSG